MAYQTLNKLILAIKSGVNKISKGEFEIKLTSFTFLLVIASVIYFMYETIPMFLELSTFIGKKSDPFSMFSMMGPSQPLLALSIIIHIFAIKMEIENNKDESDKDK